MKNVTVHWIEMRMFQVPDICPVDDIDKFYYWMEEEGGVNKFRIKGGSRDAEIVDVVPAEAEEVA